MLILSFISGILGDVIPLTLLYEKNDKNGPRYVGIVLREVLESYNRELSQTGIELEITEVADYSVYSRIPEYKNLAAYAGSDDISGRIESLQTVQKNIILLIASPEPEMAESLSRVAPCNTRLFIDINLENKIESVATTAIIKWLRRLLGMNIRSPFLPENVRKFPHGLKDIDLKERFTRCAEIEYEQDDKYMNYRNGNDKEYFNRKRTSEPNRIRHFDIESSTETVGILNKWNRKAVPDTGALNRPMKQFNKSTNKRQQPEKESFPGKIGSKIQLGTPLTMSPAFKGPSLNRAIFSQDSWKNFNGAENSKKVSKWPSITKHPPEE
ncbi:hypothetical protein PAEPH01_0792 [Pancytospora epiphaga]|nr:hypothetical protein PAEPH01_0792 [Pancytospora epiphaga]